MTDSSTPPEPPNKPPAPRRIARNEQDYPAKPEPEGRDRPRVNQRVMEQRPNERKASEYAATRGAKPDLRDLPPPRKDTPANVWRADPPPPPPRARQDAPSDAQRFDRRDGPRRAWGDAPRPDRAGERRAAPPPGGDAPRPERGPRPDDNAPRPAFRKDDRRATGIPPGPPRDHRDERRPPHAGGHGQGQGPRPSYGGTRDDGRGAQGGGDRPQYQGTRDDNRGGGPQGYGNDRGRAPYGDHGPTYPQGPNDRPRFNGARDDTRDPYGAPRGYAGAAPATPDDRRPTRQDGPGDRPPPRRRDDQQADRSAMPQRPPAPPRAPVDPDAPRREDQRLSKVLAERGVASRREADDWIDAGWVKVDGEMAVLGARVFPHQVIEIDPAAKTQQAHRVTIVLNKPIGYVSGQAEDGYEPASVLVTQANHWPEDPSRERWHPGHARGIAPAGRLDIDSTGMLVLTQDGRIARHLIGEDSDVEKEYLVRVEYPSGGQFPDNDLQRLHHGLWLDGKELRPAKVSWANEDQLRFVLREGRKRQIRRMCEAVGLVVTGLKRVRIGSVVLGKLPPGQWRYLREDERF
jgi:23S rRNA pseudouridine2604 synthase